MCRFSSLVLPQLDVELKMFLDRVSAFIPGRYKGIIISQQGITCIIGVWYLFSGAVQVLSFQWRYAVLFLKSVGTVLFSLVGASLCCIVITLMCFMFMSRI